MKKILILFYTLGILGTANGQIFGLRAGLSSANFSPTNYQSKTGFHFGGYYRYDLDRFSIEPGVQFSQKGYQSNAKYTASVIDEKLNYLDIPFLIRAEITPSINVFAGPQASFLLSRNYELDGVTSNSTEVIRGYDVGGLIGVGTKFKGGLNAQLSYDMGLIGLNYFNTDVKNQVLKISVGLDF
jgi:hypothetical protein